MFTFGSNTLNDIAFGAPSTVNFSEVEADQKLSDRLDAWWENWSATRPHFFNGSLIACQSCEMQSEGRVEIVWYRTCYAHYLQRAVPQPITAPAHALFSSVGVLSASGSLVVGRMSKRTSSPHRLQLPGGNIGLDATGSLSLSHCTEEACREFEEEVGISVPSESLKLWRVKTGGDFDDIGLVFVGRLAMSDIEIEQAFDNHQLALLDRGESPEFDRLMLVRPSSACFSESAECVDYLPGVAKLLASELG